MFEENIEQKIESNEKKIDLLKLKLERFEKGFEKIHDDLNVTPGELGNYLNNPANFETTTWNQMQNYKTELDSKLTQELENIRNPLKTSQTYAQRKEVQHHWLFVR